MVSCNDMFDTDLVLQVQYCICTLLVFVVPESSIISVIILRPVILADSRCAATHLKTH